jgi:hypothetical protein
MQHLDFVSNPKRNSNCDFLSLLVVKQPLVKKEIENYIRKQEERSTIFKKIQNGDLWMYYLF